MKGFASILLLIALTITTLFLGGLFVKEKLTTNQFTERLGATVTTTTLSDTLGTFRTNVNTAIENINDQITSSTSVDPGHKHSINSATGTITTLTATTVSSTNVNVLNASTTNQSSTGLTASNYIITNNFTATGIASTSQLYANSSTIGTLKDSQGNKYTTSTANGIFLVAAGVTIATSTTDTVSLFRTLPTASSTFNTSSTQNLRGMFAFTGTGQNSNGAAGAGCAIRVVFDNGTSTDNMAATSNGGAVSIPQNLSFTYFATSTFSAGAQHTMQVVFSSLVGGPCQVNTSTWALYLVP